MEVTATIQFNINHGRTPVLGPVRKHVTIKKRRSSTCVANAKEEVMIPFCTVLLFDGKKEKFEVSVIR